MRQESSSIQRFISSSWNTCHLHNHKINNVHKGSIYYVYIYSSANHQEFSVEGRYRHGKPRCMPQSWALGGPKFHWNCPRKMGKHIGDNRNRTLMVIIQSISGCPIFRHTKIWFFHMIYCTKYGDMFPSANAVTHVRVISFTYHPLLSQHLPYQNCDSVGIPIVADTTKKSYYRSTKLVKYPCP